MYVSGIYTAPTPKPKTTPPPQSNLLLKTWNIGEKMGKKINFPLRFEYVNFKIVSKISNLNWFFAQTREICR